jgi:hypothetical protein
MKLTIEIDENDVIEAIDYVSGERYKPDGATRYEYSTIERISLAIKAAYEKARQ